MKGLFKIFALILTVTLLLSLSACGKREEEKEPSAPPVESVSENGAVESADENSFVESTDADSTETSDEEKAEECTPLLYRAEGKDGGVLYLFGTIHLGDERMVFPDYVMQAYNESDFLCVEADVIAFETDMELQMAVVKKILCEAGKTAKDYLGEELYNDAVALLEEKDMYMSAFDYYRPIMWQSLINEALIADSDLDSEKGADMLLLKMAKEDGKEIREAEGALLQYDLLMSAGDEPLVLTVAEMINRKDSYSDELSSLYELWLAGDAEKLIEASNDDYSGYSEEDAAMMRDYNNILVNQRNIAMAQLAEDYLKEGKTGFFAVGAAHIVGDGALADLLTYRGYTVTQME